MKLSHYLILLLSVVFLTTCEKENTEYRQTSEKKSSDYYVLDINGIPRTGLTLLKASSFQQTTEYTCGPAAVVSLLNYYGREGDEMNIAKEMNTSSTCGTTPEQMSDWLNKNGFVASWYEYGNLDTLVKRLSAKTPILVEWSDWGGHWVMVIGYDTRNTADLMDDVVIFADPYDRHDDHKDGYTWFNAQRFYYMWYDARLFDRLMKNIFIEARPV